MIANLHKPESGFSLVEMIVAVAIFTGVAVIATSALLSVIDANERTQSLTQTNNNLNFSMQTMVREIRNGFSYGCDADNPEDNSTCTTSSEFGFKNAERKLVGFKLDTSSDVIKRNGNSLTPDNVKITHLNFTVRGAESNNEQSRVIITVQAESGAGDTKKTVNLQTTAAQRLLFTPSN
jgi:prepilin-type N-terminal cleavage/methylation domain-containing protein